VKSISKAGFVLVGLMLLILAAGGVAYSGCTSGAYELGEEVQFKVVDRSLGWCGCCCQCAPYESQVSGWHIATASGETIYSVVYDGSVPSSIWEGNWSQVDASGSAVTAGCYMLYVDTTVGTLSLRFKISAPCSCGCCNTMCSCCSCGTCCQKQVQGIEHKGECGACHRTNLVFIEEKDTSCCFPFFRWSCSTSCK
jgi:hypothetical protein